MTSRIPSVVLSTLVGALLAAALVAAGVNIATAPPEDNPAEKAVLVYGD